MDLYSGLEKYLNTEFIGRNIYYYDSIDSTNLRGKNIAKKEVDGTVIIAEEQSLGKGRLGRGWTSPKGKGIWMSIILKPEVHISKLPKLTLIGSAAIYKGLKDIDIKCQIKWPNDIVIDGRKLAGVLTEITGEQHIIMGLGINVNFEEEDFPKELREKAISLKIHTGNEIDRRKLIGNILNYLEKFYIDFKSKDDLREVMDICKSQSPLLNKDVRIIQGNEERIGKAIDINDKGNLVIEYPNGERESIFSGEVSVRGLDGYVDK